MSLRTHFWLPLGLLTLSSLSGCGFSITMGSGGSQSPPPRSSHGTVVVHHAPAPGHAPAPVNVEPAPRRYVEPAPRYTERTPVPVARPAPAPAPARPPAMRPVPVDTRAPVPVAAAPTPRMASPRPGGTGKADAPATGKPAPAPPHGRSVEGGGTAYERFDRTVPKRVD